MIEYTTVFSKRKSIGIYVGKDGSVEVRSPRGVSKEFIQSFVDRNSEWICEVSQKRKAEFEKRKLFELKAGDSILFLGKEYLIKNGAGFLFDGEYFYVPRNISSSELKRGITALYKKLAKAVLTNKTARYAKLMNTTFISVKITSAKTRWGSCSGRSSINYSWRLIMADEAAVDYVVVHELAHTIEHNHSKRFWNVVREYVSDYEEKRKLLAKLYDIIKVQNWD